jgi:hypothetical protein
LATRLSAALTDQNRDRENAMLCLPSVVFLMSSLSSIEVTEPPRRFPSGYADGVRPSHYLNDDKTKFT